LLLVLKGGKRKRGKEQMCTKEAILTCHGARTGKLNEGEKRPWGFERVYTEQKRHGGALQKKRA